MDFWTTVRALMKRWRIALPVYAVSLGVAGAVFLLVSTQYESTGTLVLTSSASGARETLGSAEKVNPLLAFDGSLTTTAQIVIETLKDPAIQKDHGIVDGSPVSYQIGNGQLAGPFVVVVATADNPAAANRAAAGMLALARQELDDRQQSLQAPEKTYIQAEPVISPTPGQAKIGGKVRYAAVALVLAFLAALFAVYAYERRRTSEGTRERCGRLEPAATLTTSVNVVPSPAAAPRPKPPAVPDRRQPAP